MASESLAEQSAFTNWTPLQCAGIRIETRDDLTIAGLAALRGKAAAMRAAIKAAYAIDLPSRPRRIAGDRIAFAWAGPDQWMAIAARETGRDLEKELEPIVSGLATVVDQSDGRALMSVSGEYARQVLMKGFQIDFAPPNFQLNDVAITHASHIGATIWQIDEAPTFEITMFRSFADSFADWIQHAAAEFVHA